MLNDLRLPFAMRLPVGLKWIALAWICAEILVFAAVVHVIGFGGAVLLGLGTTVLGIMMMRRIGTETMSSLRRTAQGGEPPEGALLDGMLGGLGALLLILPGFVANGVGLALAAPSVRRRATRVFGGPTAALPRARRRNRPDEVIDLGPDDWRTVDPR